MKALRRFTEHTPPGNPWSVDERSIAALTGRTRYPATVRSAEGAPRVLKSGQNSKKIGSRVVKGKWRGMPIYTLTLEERATCPRSCKQWLSCYGNKMHWAHRFASGPALETAIERDLIQLQERHPDGFVVRLHVLGDFYSLDYAEQWVRWLARFPALYVYGYTAWEPGTPIGSYIALMRKTMWDRFAIRSSGQHGTFGAVTVNAVKPHDLVCPAQTGKTDCCGTCALCWQTTRRITFLAH